MGRNHPCANFWHIRLLMRGGCLVFSWDHEITYQIIPVYWVNVARLYLTRGKTPPLRRKIQAESCCECDSAQVLQTKRSFSGMLLFPEARFSCLSLIEMPTPSKM